MKDLTTFKKNRLYTDVVNDIIEDSQEYGNDTSEANVLERINDIKYGLSSGIVSRLIYTDDIISFYLNFKTEINELLY